MQGTSRGAFQEARAALKEALGSGVDRKLVADELFGVVRLLDENGRLRRAFADPTRDGQSKVDLAKRILGDHVSVATGHIVATAVAQRWHGDRDLVDAIDNVGTEVVLRSASERGSIGAVEDELFRFNRIVAGDPELRSALTDPQATPEAKGRLVDQLVGGKVQLATAELLHRAAIAPRGRRFDRVVDEQLAVAARMQEQLSAVVTVAQPLTADQEERLRAALRTQYDRVVQLNVVVDPQVLGGIKVEVEDEVIDGTVASRLDDARRRMTAG